MLLENLTDFLKSKVSTYGNGMYYLLLGISGIGTWFKVTVFSYLYVVLNNVVTLSVKCLAMKSIVHASTCKL